MPNPVQPRPEPTTLTTGLGGSIFPGCAEARATPDAGGNPPLGLPFTNPVTGAAHLFSDRGVAGRLAGNVVASTSSAVSEAPRPKAHSLSPSSNFGFDLPAGSVLHLDERRVSSTASHRPAGVAGG